jgi:signal transduction histidine kinase
MLAAIGVAAVFWVGTMLRLTPPWTVAVCGACGVLLQGLAPSAGAPFYLIATTLLAAQRMTLRAASAVTVALAAALAVVQVLGHVSLPAILGWALAIAVTLLVSVIRQLREQQAAQARALEAETETSRHLAERAHLAREIHDVLAHSLSALSVQLETAAALLERDRTAEAAAVVEKAGRLTRDGLAETRRAVSALRGDPLPVPDLVAALADNAALEVEGEPRPLPAEAGLALYRSAQEALTNARRHAPGAAVRIRLAYLPGSVELTVTNDAPAEPPTARMPAGYGLTGLRERAELAGGTFTAGPDNGGWRVDVKIPA